MTTKNETVTVRGEDMSMSELESLTPVIADRDPAPTPAPDAITHLRDAGREPIRIWKAKGPKMVGGVIEAVLCQDVNEIVLVHTLDSGKWSLFTKVAK